MYGYTVHMLFHFLACLIGIACGVAAAFWLLGAQETAKWLFAATVVAGVLTLLAQAAYIRNTPTPQARGQQRFAREHGHVSPSRPAVRSSPHIDIIDSSSEFSSESRTSGSVPAGSTAKPRVSRTGTRPEINSVDSGATSASETEELDDQRRRANPPNRHW